MHSHTFLYPGSKTQRRLVFIFTAVLFILPSIDIWASGSRESEVQTEEPTSADVYIVYMHTAGTSPSRTPLPGAQAAFYIFQDFSRKEGVQRISSDRQFSMPVEKKQRVKLPGEIEAYHYSLNIKPNTAKKYSLLHTIDVSFSLEELVVNGRVNFQPAQKAALDALTRIEEKEGMVRIKRLSMSEKGKIDAVVQIAEKASSATSSN